MPLNEYGYTCLHSYKMRMATIYVHTYITAEILFTIPPSYVHSLSGSTSIVA